MSKKTKISDIKLLMFIFALELVNYLTGSSTNYSSGVSRCSSEPLMPFISVLLSFGSFIILMILIKRLLESGKYALGILYFIFGTLILIAIGGIFMTKANGGLLCGLSYLV